MEKDCKRKEKIVSDALIDEYCTWLHGCEKSKETIIRYRHHLCLFMSYLNGRSAGKGNCNYVEGCIEGKNGSCDC